MIDLAKKDVPASESKNTSKKIKNTQSKIANMNDAIIKRVQKLGSKGLIDTVEEIKNGGAWITVKGFVTIVIINDSVS